MLEERVARLIRTIPDFPKKGVEFQDITPILYDVPLVAEMVDAFAEAGRETGVNTVVGIESRGFFFGPLIAYKLGVPFLVVRKRGSFPGVTATFSTYDIEYGSASIEMNINDLPENARVMIHDDLLATGVTATAAANLLRHAGAEVAMFSFVGHLTFLDGAEKLLSYSPNIFTLAEL
jgi:adenine phosphoribosyltransferase